MRMEEENSREAAEKLQQIGSSILGAARDELYLGMRFLDVALSSFCISDGFVCQSLWNGWSSDIFSPAAAWGLVPAESDSCEPGISAHGVSLYFPAFYQTGHGRALLEFEL